MAKRRDPLALRVPEPNTFRFTHLQVLALVARVGEETGRALTAHGRHWVRQDDPAHPGDALRQIWGYETRPFQGTEAVRWSGYYILMDAGTPITGPLIRRALVWVLFGMRYEASTNGFQFLISPGEEGG